MKNLEIKLSIFGFLLILATSVFFTSCEQELDITPETAFSEKDEFQSDENPMIFILPEEFNDMSDEEIKIFFENTSFEELSEIVTIISQEDIEMRGCGSWYPYGSSSCNSNDSCSGKRKSQRYRRDCTNWFWELIDYGPIPEFKYEWGNCCPW